MLFLLLVIAPYTVASTVSDYMARTEILRDMTNFTDTVADNRIVTQQNLEDFTLNISSHGMIVSPEITKYTLVTNPKPGTTNEIAYTLVKQEGEVGAGTEFVKGDYIVVRVKSLGYNGAQRIIMGILNAFYPTFDCTLPCRIR